MTVLPQPDNLSIPVSVLILTRNEEANIEQCLRNVRFSEDIVVLDSFSTDRTLELVKTFPGVRVVQRVFDTEYRQRNYGLHDIQYKHDWVYICDADERVPGDMVAEMRDVANRKSNPCAAYRIRYKNMFLGRWIKHSSGYPVWIIRLVRPGSVSYEVRETNVHPIVQGRIGELKTHFVHYSFNSGLRRWFDKHDFYSSREAAEGAKVRAQRMTSWSTLTNADPMVRRRALKNLSYFLIGRGVWRFLHSYFLRGGWLDGTAGFHYCMMISMYEYWIELKIREIERPWRATTLDLATRLLVEQ